MLVIADRDVDHAQAALLAVRNAGLDHPVFYARNAKTLIGRLQAAPGTMPCPSAILIDLDLLRECGPELMRCLQAIAAPVELVAMLAGERERVLLDECGFRQIGCLVRPISAMDVLRLFGMRAKSRTPPAGHPRLLWPARPADAVRPILPQPRPH